MTAHYSPSAYQPARIPDQPAATKRSWVFRFGNSRLPWGHTEDIVPLSILRQSTPEGLRTHEKYKQDLAAGLRQEEKFAQRDYHQINDHERIRYAPFSKRTTFWFYLWGGALFWVSLIFSPIGWLALADVDPEGFTKGLVNIVVETAPWFLGVPLACWAIGSLVVHKFTNWVVRPSRAVVGVQPPHRHGHDLRLRQYGRVQTQWHYR